MERAVILSNGKQLQLDIPLLEPAAARSSRQLGPTDATGEQPILTAQQLREFEIENIRRALEAAEGRVYGPDGAAELLGLKATTLASKIKSLSIN